MAPSNSLQFAYGTFLLAVWLVLFDCDSVLLTSAWCLCLCCDLIHQIAPKWLTGTMTRVWTQKKNLKWIYQLWQAADCLLSGLRLCSRLDNCQTTCWLDPLQMQTQHRQREIVQHPIRESMSILLVRIQKAAVCGSLTRHQE